MQLVKYDAACRAIAECRQVDEIKDWVDKAAAVEAYGRISKNFDIERDGAEIRIRATRRLGELLNAMPKNTGAAGIGTSAVASFDRTQPPTLSDYGISKYQSSEAQSIARIPEEQFEQTLAEHREEQRIVTTRTMAKLNKQAEAIQAPTIDEARLFDDLMTAWERATPDVKARFIEAVQRQEWAISPVGAAAPNPASTAWAAYAISYHERYGIEPVRNATVNGQLSQLVKRIGGFDAPHVARFYVHNNAAFYVRCGHSVGMLLKDCEKLRTEWATNTRMTETKARQVDQTETQGQVWQKLLREAENDTGIN
jgi:uncharacterized membrane protein